MIQHLQSVQGMANFLRRFVVNDTNLTKGFMHLLKKDTPFIWDERDQYSFDTLNKSLASTPLLSPPKYNRYLLLYVVVYEQTFGVVLFQEDDELQENGIVLS